MGQRGQLGRLRCLCPYRGGGRNGFVMDDETDLPDRPLDLPKDLGDALEAHSTEANALQEAIIFAQELLNAHHQTSPPIEPRDDEEILSWTDKGEYTSVIKRKRGQSDAYLYHVRREPRPDGTDRLRWVLMGRVNPDDI